MSYRPDTTEQARAKNRFFSYRRGWMDAARSQAMSKEDTSEEYKEGYNHGYKARKTALHEATDRFGYEQRIIRAI